MTEASESPGIEKQAHKMQPDLRSQFRKADQVSALMASLPKWIAYAVIAWQARLSIEAMTGKSGIASLLVRFGREASYWEVVCWTSGIAGILFGVYSRHLLRRHMAHDASRLDSLERRLNLSPGSDMPANEAAAKSAEKL